MADERSAYVNCGGCGTTILRLRADGTSRSHCSVCEARQGEAPPPMFNLGAQKRPPYETPSAISPRDE